MILGFGMGRAGGSAALVPLGLIYPMTAPLDIIYPMTAEQYQTCAMHLDDNQNNCLLALVHIYKYQRRYWIKGGDRGSLVQMFLH